MWNEPVRTSNDQDNMALTQLLYCTYLLLDVLMLASLANNPLTLHCHTND